MLKTSTGLALIGVWLAGVSGCMYRLGYEIPPQQVDEVCDGSYGDCDGSGFGAGDLDSANNSAPSISQSCDTLIDQDASYLCSPLVNDSDLDTWTWNLALSNTCAWAVIDGNTGALSGTPNDDQVGNCALAFMVNDGSVDSAIETITITINNIQPTLSVSNATDINEDSASSIPIKSDADVRASEEGFGVYRIIAGSLSDCQSVGTVSIDSATGEISFAPTEDYNGMCTINVQFDDENASNNLVSSEFSITVTPQNDAPIVSGECSISIAQNLTYSCQPNIVDPDIDETHSWDFGTSHDCGLWLSIDANTGALSGSPSLGAPSCTVGIQANDGDIDSNEYTYALTVLDPNATGSVVFVTKNGYAIGGEIFGRSSLHTICQGLATAKGYPGVWTSISSVGVVYPVQDLRRRLIDSSTHRIYGMEA